MPMNSESWIGAREARIDRAIDRAVREMMDLDPPPGLRRRVLARLSMPETQRTWWLPRYALASAALTVLLLSLTALPRETEPPARPSAPSIFVATAPSVPDANTSVRVLETAQPEATPPVPHAQGFTRERIPMPRVSNVFGTRTNSVSPTVDRTSETGATRRARIDVDALPPLRLVPLSERPIEIPPLVVVPLAMPGPPKLNR